MNLTWKVNKYLGIKMSGSVNTHDMDYLVYGYLPFKHLWQFLRNKQNHAKFTSVKRHWVLIRCVLDCSAFSYQLINQDWTWTKCGFRSIMDDPLNPAQNPNICDSYVPLFRNVNYGLKWSLIYGLEHLQYIVELVSN